MAKEGQWGTDFRVGRESLRQSQQSDVRPRSVNQRVLRSDDTLFEYDDDTLTPVGSRSITADIVGDVTGDVTGNAAGTETDLASTATGDGASMIGVEDSAANFTGTTVEAVLAELAGAEDEEVTVSTSAPSGGSDGDVWLRRDGSNDGIHVKQSGTWNELDLIGGSSPSITYERLVRRTSQSYANLTGLVRVCAMGPNEFVYRDNNGSELAYMRRPYRGGTWALVGSSLAINTNAPAVAALSRYEIATYDPTIDRVRTYQFSGSTWSHISGEDGTAFASSDWPDMCSMNSNRVALALDGTNSGVTCFDRSSGTWTKVGNTKAETWGRRPAITALTESRVVVADSTNDTVRVYDFDDMDFTQIATLSESGMMNGVGLTAIDSTHFALTADGIDDIILYEFDGVSTITKLISVSVTNDGWCDLAALGPDEILYARGNESPGYFETYDIEYYVESVPPNPAMAASYGRGAV